MGSLRPSNPTAGDAAGFQILLELTIEFSALRDFQQLPMRRAGGASRTAGTRYPEASGRLPAEEGRDVQMILLGGIMHRPLTPMGVETLVSRRAPGVVGDRIGAA